MINKKSLKKNLFSIIVITSLILGMLTPITNAKQIDSITGFDKGPSYTNVVPMKKVTFVNFDEDTLIDDYAYLASVPTAVFKDQEKDRLFSHPLLFYQDKLDYNDDKYRILDTFPGIEYFMEDYMSYCNGKLDEMTIINLDENKVSQWATDKITKISSDNPYELTGQIALNDWSYSKDAVIAVIDKEFKTPNIKHEGVLEGFIPSDYKTKNFKFQMDKPEIGVAGNYQDFEINKPYKYVIANMYWDNVAIDLDLQLYDDKLGMADADSKWNIFYGAGETTGSYVYDYGKWEVGVTYMPTKASSDEGIMKEKFNNVKEETGLLSELGLGGSNKQDVQINLYPGVEVEIDDPIPYGCRNVNFTLEWNNPNIVLGFLVLDPAGAETASTPSCDEIIKGVEKGATERSIKLERLGETAPREKYKICVFSLNNITNDLNFKVKYNWEQNYTRERGDMLASATEGAVLASTLNAPLLYTSKENLSEITSEVLYKLGVENIYIVDLGGYLSKDAYNELKQIGHVIKFNDYKEIYNIIKSSTGSKDVIISTVDPWTYYYSLDLVPVDEYPGALFIGPAAYIAAHHGAPVVIVDNHPELSQAVVWHTEFWRKTANDKFRPNLPSVACMVLTGRNVINFLESIGFDLPKDEENLATMITVADQFDIGMTWDRTFTGRLIPGRFCSSPVDIAYWSSRSFFYPALIFENPALDSSGITLVNGSKSKVIPILGKLMKPLGTDLVIYRPSQEEEYIYPVLNTYNVFLIDFNKIASKHWGGVYTTANGIIPYVTPSPYPIDNGATDKVGAFYADIDETYAVPFYSEKAGYSNCYSTNFDVAIANLNKGVIMWMEACHGGNGNYGQLSFWNTESPYIYEENPWRAYERPLISAGTLKEFTKYAPELLHEMGMPSFKLLFKLGSFLSTPINLLTVDWGSTDDPDVVVMNPQIPISTLVDAFRVDYQIKESKGRSLIPIIGRQFRAYGDDGVVIDPLPGGENVLTVRNGIMFDENLTNLHSCGLNAVSCLIANSYLHTTFIRHGTPYQILDPWSTSWYSSIWLHGIPRALALGKTIGQAYEEGMAEVGIEYLVNQWWWDLNENVIFYGDPDLRVWTPSTEYDYEANNHWEKDEIRSITYDADLTVNGHMPFGAVSYPNAREKQELFFGMPFWFVVLLVIIILFIIIVAVFARKKK
ncbi:MAG: hypothetical protein MUO82_01885 [Candidatus Thermoplasmatota archaeon]|nr:hypothetical protein [Candidatus Thermoplasmatota archaeon]